MVHSTLCAPDYTAGDTTLSVELWRQLLALLIVLLAETEIVMLLTSQVSKFRAHGLGSSMQHRQKAAAIERNSVER